jgi:glutamine transport system substrate-binding protein
MDFNGLIPGLTTGNLDVALAAIFIKSAREEKIDFSHPYFRAGLKVMVRSDNTDIKEPADLKGKVVAVKLGTATVEYVETLGAKKLVKFPNIDQAYLEVATGGADAAMHDTPNVLYYIKTAGQGKVKAVGPDVKAAQYGIAFPQGSELRDKVNVVLLQMMEDGAYAKLYRKWFDADPE